MKQLVDRVLRRDVPLADRFHNGVRMGFIITVAVAVATFALTSMIGSAIESKTELAAMVEDQRLDLSRMAVDLQLLADADLPDAKSELRLAIGETLDGVRNRQAQIDIADPLAVAMMVGGGGGTRLDSAVADLIDSFGNSVRAIEIAPGQPFAEAAVADTMARLGPLDAAFAEIGDRAESSTSRLIVRLRTSGQLIALAAAIAAASRLLIAGLPLVQKLQSEQAEMQFQRESRRSEATERDLASRLADGMEAANTEAAALKVLERAMAQVVPDRPAELLLADSSMAHMTLVAINEKISPPGCNVTSPWSCPAVRRSETIVFEDSDSIRACPYLVGRPSGRCAAACVPVSFMGGAMGVLHVTGAVGWKPPEQKIDSLRVLARQTAMRIGTLRSFAKAEVQASTDVLTGLPNRRATDDHLGTFLATRQRGSVAMADLDHFKSLNDTYGHEIGDRALRLFATAARAAIREADWIGRWGGEEFLLVLPGLSSTEAAKVLERVRQRLADACARSDTPTFTVSLGVVDTTAGTTAEDLVRMADDCLYVAKEEGRDCIIIGPVAPKDADADQVVETDTDVADPEVMA